jgi:hypothetical protein
VTGGIAAGVELPAAGVQPVQLWRRELVAESGWLPGDQGVVAVAGPDGYCSPFLAAMAWSAVW